MPKIFACVLLLFPSFLFAQISIEGSVMDTDQQPIEFAEVILLTQDSTALMSALSDETGHFTLETPAGNYLLEIRQIGKMLYAKDIAVSANLNLGTIQVDAATQLTGVVVEGRKKMIERKVDRLVFNVSGSIAASGGDALDALKITPGLKVQNSQVSMIGKDAMAVMINGRLLQLSGDELMNYLKTIRSGNIKSIEVITNPPAKYSAEGNSGLVNIQLQDPEQNSWNASLYTAYQQATYATGSGGGSLNYQQNRLSFFSNINYENGSRNPTETDNIVYPSQTWKSSFNNRRYSDILSGRIGLDYKLSDAWSVGAQYLGSYSQPSSFERNRSLILSHANLAVDSILNTVATDQRDIASNSFNAHSVVQLDTTGRSISVDLDYLGYGNDNRRNFSTQAFDQHFQPISDHIQSVENTGLQNIAIYSANVDVTYPTQWIDLTFGGKVYFSKTDYQNRYFDIMEGESVLRPERSNTFVYDENTQALYFSGAKKLSEQWSFQLGLRAENTQTKGNSVTLTQVNYNRYLKLFPTFYLVNNPNENNSFSLTYGRRLSRPRYNELNPFQYYYSPYSYTQGNPFLSPSYTDNVEFQHGYKDVFYSALSYSHTTKGRGNPPFFDEATQVQALIDLNFFTINKYNLTESYVFNRWDWWESDLQANVYLMTMHITQEVDLPDTQGWGAYFSANNRFVLNRAKTLSGELNVWYAAPQYENIYKNQGMGSLDLGVRSSLLHKKLQLALVAEDLLRTNRYQARTQSGGLDYAYSTYDDSRMVRISLNYKLGSSDLSVNKRDFGNEEEKSRIDN